jgi:uncharacterized protein (UPF0335 family)
VREELVIGTTLSSGLALADLMSLVHFIIFSFGSMSYTALSLEREIKQEREQERKREIEYKAQEVKDDFSEMKNSSLDVKILKLNSLSKKIDNIAEKDLLLRILDNNYSNRSSSRLSS